MSNFHKNQVTYFTHDNGGRPFKVTLKSSGVVKIFVSTAIVPKGGIIVFEPKLYTRFLKGYDASNIFIGKSPLNETTKFSGAYGKPFDGNSILLKLNNLSHSTSNKYIFIGSRIFEFETEEPILKFYSTISNNDVPYPVAFTKSHVYIMSELEGFWALFRTAIVRLDKEEFPSDFKDWSDASYYYFESGHKFASEKLINISVIQKRLY